MEEWLTMKSTDGSIQHERQYRQITRDYILPQLGSKKLLKISAGPHPGALQHNTFERGQPPHCPAGARRPAGIAQPCGQTGTADKNPTAWSSHPNPRPREKQVLDENQIQTLLIAAQEKQPEFLPLYQLAITTGMRLGELLGIGWDDLDWDKGTLTINRQLKRVTDKDWFCNRPKPRQAGARSSWVHPPGRFSRSIAKSSSRDGSAAILTGWI